MWSAMTTLNQWVSRHLIKATATDNMEGERVGLLNRIYARLGQAGGWTKRLKKANKPLYRLAKYTLAAVILYVIFVR
jgi:beta-hydroxylase